MLEARFNSVYTKFKLQFYRNIFGQFEKREASLSTVETFCIEIIYALKKPTINEFAQFAQISKPNATYKINSLVRKGYIKKVQSTVDKREFYLEVTPKFFTYYNISINYIQTVSERMRARFNDAELAQLEEFMRVIADELMPEIPLP